MYVVCHCSDETKLLSFWPLAGHFWAIAYFRRSNCWQYRSEARVGPLGVVISDLFFLQLQKYIDFVAIQQWLADRNFFNEFFRINSCGTYKSGFFLYPAIFMWNRTVFVPRLVPGQSNSACMMVVRDDFHSLSDVTDSCPSRAWCIFVWWQYWVWMDKNVIDSDPN